MGVGGNGNFKDNMGVGVWMGGGEFDYYPMRMIYS